MKCTRICVALWLLYFISSFGIQIFFKLRFKINSTSIIMKSMKLLFSFFFLMTFLNTDAQLVLESFVSGFSQPVDITNAGDERLFVVERAGRIRIIENGNILSTPFLNITSQVSSSPNERGLLGLAFHPDYANNGYFYVNYTRSDGDSRISRFSVSGDPNVAILDTEVILLEADQPEWNHNGGCVKFGPDGYLYIGLGDGGGGGDNHGPIGNGQNPQTFLGKILRIDVDNGIPYSIPATNPFVGNNDVLDEIWALGLRNPWRFSFDSETGDLWIGDVGQNVWEEIDFQPANSTGGENYGWRCYEGNAPFNTSGCEPAEDYIAPVLDYSQAGNDHCSVTGGFVYRGCIMPDFVGHYIYADYCSGIFWSIAPDTIGGWTNTQIADYGGYDISSFGEDVNGELYVARLSQGRIYKVTSSNTVPIEITADANVLMAPSGYVTYQWYLDNDLIVGATGETYDATETGVYTVEVTTADGCTFLSEQYGHTLVGIKDIPSLQDFRINPNPFDNELEIVISVNEPTAFSLKLLDLEGKKIMEDSFTVSSYLSKVLNLEKLPAAVYFLSLESESGNVVKRVIKK
jgi:glucose/arabinose dehydrogenase